MTGNLDRRQRISFGLVAVLLLVLMYMLQRTNYCLVLFSTLGLDQPADNTQFIFNKTFRFIINDLSVILLIYVLFENIQLIKIAFAIQIFGLLIILPLYFYFKLTFEGTSEISSPLLSFVHRIIVNPILMLLLIPAFYYQSTINK